MAPQNHASTSHVVDLVPDLSQNPSSHYYIHPGENSSIPVVNPLLTQKNYHTWAKLMLRALISKNKWKFLDGSIPVPDRFDPSFDAWEKCNNLIHSWLVNFIAQSLIHIDLVSIVWKNLRERFSQGDLVRIAELQQELYSFKQGNLSVTEFFNELTAYWEELENYKPVLDYNCESKKFRNQDYIMRFLMGLNDYYFVIKTQVLLMDPLPSLNRIFSMILQYERQNGFDNVEENQ